MFHFLQTLARKFLEQSVDFSILINFDHRLTVDFLKSKKPIKFEMKMSKFSRSVSHMFNLQKDSSICIIVGILTIG